MSWTCKSGQAIDPPRRKVPVTPGVKARSRALAMARFKDQGWTLREIGDYFGISHPQTVKRIISRVPPEARRLSGASVRVG